MPKLLLADDSVTIRKVVELTFADEGIEVISVADGDAAMLKFADSPPDIVLADVEMPGQNGYKICEFIKQEEATRNIPVLLLVGSFEPFDQTEAERVGADGFLTKPFHSIRDLVARVKDLLESATGEEPAGPETEDIEELYTTSFAETVPFHEGETDEDPLSDTSMDDEMVETVQPAASYVGNGSGDSAAAQEAIDATVGTIDLPETETAETAATPSDVRFAFADSYDHLDPAIHDSKADTEEIKSPFAAPASMDHTLEISETAPAPSDAGEAREPSEEVIALIVKRVVEKMSDRVVRDIAQEAVPRIAEKLIREALEEENKS
jgi:CheY-like chemotaxis protein